MNRPVRLSLLSLSLLAVLSVAACKREQPTPDPAPAEPVATTEQPAAIELTDVVEHNPRYLVGITYPPLANRYPGLAHAIKAYSDAARADLDEALEGIEELPESMIYSLALDYREVLDSPAFAAIAANGDLFTGGAHGNPLMGRWVWLPQRNEMLTAARLVPEDGAWDAIATYVRQQLSAALEQRVEEDNLEPAIRADVLRSGRRMIEEGTQPLAENFDEFEPVVDASGRLSALRFVFPPYQVGPYSDGVQTVEVPAAVLLPKVAPEYRELFVGG